MFTVEIRLPQQDDAALTLRMNAMREWLDHRRVEPTAFFHNFEPDGLNFRVTFTIETEASAFAGAFAGRLIPAAATAAAAVW